MKQQIPSSDKMSTTRFETFSDGVIAVIITIMALELKVPHGTQWTDLRALIPSFVVYAISFSIIGTYWNNHHHMVHALRRITPGVMWANLHLLFWLSLIPLMTSWLGERYTAAVPTACYAILLTVCGGAYRILQHHILNTNSDKSLQRRFSRDYKGTLSVVVYLAAVPLAWVNHWLSDAIFLAMAIVWFIPDHRYVAEAERS